MKVVLFCGGLGTRLREYSETIPKPMVEVGPRPILWHLMRYYAHFGHKEFILCLGYRGDAIKRYFLNYEEHSSNDFVLTRGGKCVRLTKSEIEDWTISFIDTGINTKIGQRLLAVRRYLGDDAEFLANYADGLSDLDLDEYLANFRRQGAIASFLCVRPSQSYHTVEIDDDGRVRGLQAIGESSIWINGGFFAFRKEIFDYIQDGEELVDEPFRRLIARNQLIAHRNTGFWACMDTLKEKVMFDEMYASGNTPWAVWERCAEGGERRVHPTLAASDTYGLVAGVLGAGMCHGEDRKSVV